MYETREQLVQELKGEAKTKALNALQKHLENAKNEYEYYNYCRRSLCINCDCVTVRIVFDFAEKVLLPRMSQQPGKFHFKRGLKFNMFMYLYLILVRAMLLDYQRVLGQARSTE